MAFKVDTKKAIELRKSGKKLQEDGNVFGVTRERIRQILNEVGGMKKYNHTYLVDDFYPKGYKRCYHCKKTLKLEVFYTDKGGIRGRSNNCTKCQKEIVKKYNKKYAKEYCKGGKYYQKQKARAAVYQALKRNKLKKGHCVFKNEECKGRIEGHHYLGYEKKHYFDVEWICRKHHRLVDKLQPFGRLP